MSYQRMTPAEHVRIERIRARLRRHYRSPPTSNDRARQAGRWRANVRPIVIDLVGLDQEGA